MAAMSVVQYTTTTPHKNILQQTDNIITKEIERNEESLMGKASALADRRDVIILRRKRKLSPIKDESENYLGDRDTFLNLEKPKHILRVETTPVKDESNNLRQVRLNNKNVVQSEIESSQERLSPSSVRRKELSGIPISSVTVRQTRIVVSKDNDVDTDDESDIEDKIKVNKLRPILPNYVTNSDRGMIRKPRQPKYDLDLSSHSTRITKPQSLSIQRRNARERNRVKQVNNGFANLRSKIPDYISEEYCHNEKVKKSTKKLSKVETLRMAVDYIKHLESLLGYKEDLSDKLWINEETDWNSKNENWNTSNSSNGYPSPVDAVSPTESVYPSSYIESPNTPYDQTYVYPDVGHDYVIKSKNGYEVSRSVLISDELEESRSPDNVNVAPTRIKIEDDVLCNVELTDENGSPVKLVLKEELDDGMYVDETDYLQKVPPKVLEDENFVNSVRYLERQELFNYNLVAEDVDNHSISPQNVKVSPNMVVIDTNDSINDINCSNLPSINESFSNTNLSSAFFNSQFLPYQLINLCTKEQS